MVFAYQGRPIKVDPPQVDNVAVSRCRQKTCRCRCFCPPSQDLSPRCDLKRVTTRNELDDFVREVFWMVLLAEILHQLRLVVYPIIYRVSYIPGGARFQPSTVSPWRFYGGLRMVKKAGWHTFYINLEPLFDLYFWRSTTQNKAFSNQNKGHLGLKIVVKKCGWNKHTKKRDTKGKL